jgi:hypothetical protein
MERPAAICSNCIAVDVYSLDINIIDLPIVTDINIIDLPIVTDINIIDLPIVTDAAAFLFCVSNLLLSSLAAGKVQGQR